MFRVDTNGTGVVPGGGFNIIVIQGVNMYKI